MNWKIRIFKAVSYINLSSMLIFLGIFLYELDYLNLKQLSFDDLLGFLLLLLIFVIFGGNFYYASKLTSRFNKEMNTIRYNNKIRLTFFILEILLAIVYSIFIFYTILQVKWSNIWPIVTYQNLTRLIVLVCLFTGYLSSLLRLFLTRSILIIITQQDKQFIEQLGKYS
jgi:hypothetical protein